MAYEPTNWKAGDVVTSAKLNKIEQGIAAGGGVLIAHDEDGTLDKTWQEIYDADVCIIVETIENSFKDRSYVGQTIIEGLEDDKEYKIYIGGTSNLYTASSPESYPILQEGGGK